MNLLEAIISQSIPNMHGDGFISKIIDESDTVTYVGFAKRGSPTNKPRWKVVRIVISGNTTTTTTSEYAQVMDDYLSLTYL